MNNFGINTNFNSEFNNSISDFNKIFSDSIKNTNKNINSSMSFEEIFNSPTDNSKPLKTGVEISVDTSKKELSPSEKLTKDIASGFSDSLRQLNETEKKSETDIETFASGGDISIHEVMISAQKSQLAMQMAIQLRNQMLNAYNEFKNMSI